MNSWSCTCREAAAKLNINREVVLADIVARSGAAQSTQSINGVPAAGPSASACTQCVLRQRCMRTRPGYSGVVETQFRGSAGAGYPGEAAAEVKEAVDFAVRRLGNYLLTVRRAPLHSVLTTVRSQNHRCQAPLCN